MKLSKKIESKSFANYLQRANRFNEENYDRSKSTELTAEELDAAKHYMKVGMDCDEICECSINKLLRDGCNCGAMKAEREHSN